MKIEIDQSGKVENTSVPTVIADSVGNVVWISAKDKRTLQQYYRTVLKPKKYVLEVFAILLAILIQKTCKTHNTYVIDIEYYGKDVEIRGYLSLAFQKFQISLLQDSITFRSIGKKSQAHKNAYLAFCDNKRKGVTIVALRDIF